MPTELPRRHADVSRDMRGQLWWPEVQQRMYETEIIPCEGRAQSYGLRTDTCRSFTGTDRSAAYDIGAPVAQNLCSANTVHAVMGIKCHAQHRLFEASVGVRDLRSSLLIDIKWNRDFNRFHGDALRRWKLVLPAYEANDECIMSRRQLIRLREIAKNAVGVHDEP